ncbi:hypothetical protein Tsubulata_037080, partial [Turnera subulata]
SENDAMSSDQPVKPRRAKSREVSSRFLSPTHDNGNPSPSKGSSPLHQKSGADTRKHRSLEDPGVVRGLWPSASPSHHSSTKKNVDTLADHLGNERLKDLLDRKKEEKSTDKNSVFSLSRQRSATLFSRRKSDASVDDYKSESECSEAADCSSPAISKTSRKSGIEVPSKYMLDMPSRSRRWTADSNIQSAVSLDSSPKVKKSAFKNAIKRVNSLTGYGSATSQWALSPGRSGSPPLSVESKERLISFSSLKPPTSPSRAKGVEKLLHLGLDLFKGKKSSSSGSSPAGSANVESIHQLRLLHNRHLQWRYANARADVVNGNITKQVEDGLVHALDSLGKLEHSVLLKKLQLQKEKLKMKLDSILYSQIKPLEAWGDMERQHLSAVSKTKECLHSVVCRVPLTEGAKVDPQSASVALRQASDLAASMKSTLTVFSPSEQKTAALISELAEVVAHEKLLLEECIELLQTISLLEIQERSLKCYILQFNMWEQQLQQQQQQQQQAIPS